MSAEVERSTTIVTGRLTYDKPPMAGERLEREDFLEMSHTPSACS
jgi:hypothetical protein